MLQTSQSKKIRGYFHIFRKYISVWVELEPFQFSRLVCVMKIENERKHEIYKMCNKAGIYPSNNAMFIFRKNL